MGERKQPASSSKSETAHLEEGTAEAAEQHFKKIVGEEVKRQVGGIVDQLGKVLDLADRLGKVLPLLENLSQTVEEKVVEVVKPAVEGLKARVEEQGESFAQQIDSSLDAKLESFKPLVERFQALVQANEANPGPGDGQPEDETGEKRRLPIGSLLGGLDIGNLTELIKAFKGGDSFDNMFTQAAKFMEFKNKLDSMFNPGGAVDFAKGYESGHYDGRRQTERLMVKGAPKKNDSISPNATARINSVLSKPSEIDELLED